MMKKIFDFLRKHYLIIAILAAGFCLRCYGIFFDYPQGVNYIWDEIFSVVYLLDALEYRTFFLTSYNYPLLLPWMYLPVLLLRIVYIAIVHGIFNLNELKNFLVMGGMGQLYIIVRWYSVVFGTATIYLLYRIYRSIFENKSSWYFLSAAYATSLVPVFLSHWGKTHAIMVFFLVLSLYYILEFERNKELKFFYRSAIAAAASISIHYIGVSAAVFPFLGFIFNRKSFNAKAIAKGIVLYAAITSLFYLSNFTGVKLMVDNVLGYFGRTGFTGMSRVGLAERFYYVLRDSFNLDPVFVTLFVAMLLFKFRRIFNHLYLRYILYGLLFNYLLMSSVIAWPQMSRWLLIFVTLAIPLGAGLFFEELNKKIASKRVIAAVAAVLLLPNLLISFLWLNLLQDNTMTETARWLEQNLKQGEVAYSFDMYLDAPLNYTAALWHKENNKVVAAKKINFIIDHKETYENRGIDLRYDYGFKRYDSLGGAGTKYIIIVYWQSGETSERVNLITRKAAREYIAGVEKFHSLRPARSFTPTDDARLNEIGVEDYLNNPLDWRTLIKLRRSGPFVDIYQVLN